MQTNDSATGVSRRNMKLSAVEKWYAKMLECPLSIEKILLEGSDLTPYLHKYTLEQIITLLLHPDSIHRNRMTSLLGAATSGVYSDEVVLGKLCVDYPEYALLVDQVRGNHSYWASIIGGYPHLIKYAVHVLDSVPFVVAALCQNYLVLRYLVKDRLDYVVEHDLFTTAVGMSTAMLYLIPDEYKTADLADLAVRTAGNTALANRGARMRGAFKHFEGIQDPRMVTLKATVEVA